jgi:cytochrome c peroxidase
VFGKKELAGLKLFFRAGNDKQSGGNCASCHTAPHFTDFAFHNTGLTQHNYDQLHGNGAFNKLAIPGLARRNADYEAYLPATASHPRASSRFRSIPRADKPGYTDLGLWNVFANPDMPNPQDKLTALLCQQAKKHNVSPCNPESLLDMSIARFKTPGLRDLGHANPYMHTGQFDDLQQSVGFYIVSSALAKSGQLRNSDPALRAIRLTADDIEPLVAFLESLNEDYE